MSIDEITGEIVDGAITVHKAVGPGLLESVYQTLLSAELAMRGLVVERQKHVVFEYGGITFHEGLRLDLLVNEAVVVELKSVEVLQPVHRKQLLTYLRVLKLPVGLLINFGGATLKEGLRRVVINYEPPETPNTPRLPHIPRLHMSSERQ
jgi:GxxExxY protein